MDGGQTWKEATLKPPLSGYTWVLWATEWLPPANGVYHIVVRAMDQSGMVQTAQVRNPFPAGATGHHAVIVNVEGA